VDFELNEDQRMLQKTARDFLKKECPKALVRELDDSDEGHSPELWSKMADLGWTGLLLPEEYNGIGWTFIEMAVLMEEMGYNICPGPFVSTTILGSLPLLMAGSDEQKRELLPKAADGELILTMAVSEADGGFEASTLNLEAAKKGEKWVLNGTKLFVSDALVADYILCVARTEAASDPEDGLTIFLVDAKASGVNITATKTISKDKQCEVAFDNVSLDDAAVVGSIGGAWPVVKAVMDRAAVARSAETLGSMRAALDMSVAYANDRVQFGRPIGSYQAVQHFLADIWVDIIGTRTLIMKAAWKLATDQPADREVGMAKARAGEAGRKATFVGHRIFGAIGFTMEHDLHLYHRRTVAADMAFGDSDYQHEQIAKSLGL
jgi:alkylation response protein AidB-like acyl-CoA dehydrogenase